MPTERGNGSMLVGKYSHNLDSKNRLFIPAKHREELGPKFMITRNVDNCLSVYSMEAWERYTEKINSLPRTQAREILRFVYSNAAAVEPDSQGRVQLSEDLKKFAGIERGVVILGCGEYAEIWSEEARMVEESDEKTDDILALMLEAGL